MDDMVQYVSTETLFENEDISQIAVAYSWEEVQRFFGRNIQPVNELVRCMFIFSNKFLVIL